MKGLIIVLPALMLAHLLSSCAVKKPPPMDPAHVMQADEHLRLGAVYEAQGDYDLALREYEKTVELDPANAKAHFAAAGVYLKFKKYAEAEKGFFAAAKLSPQNPSYHNNLGWVYMENGKFNEAEVSAQTALKLDPQKGYIYLDTLGVIEMRRGDYDASEKYLLDAKGLAPLTETEGRKEIYSHLIELYVKSGDWEEATAIKEALEKGMTP
ncbi:MAG: tetratricopeptide repeat protein [Deltaproteobacteria bacterium]|nr:tetratricopeptide repeat protein [Deltaproteobacteria bacterium]